MNTIPPPRVSSVHVGQVAAWALDGDARYTLEDATTGRGVYLTCTASTTGRVDAHTIKTALEKTGYTVGYYAGGTALTIMLRRYQPCDVERAGGHAVATCPLCGDRWNVPGDADGPIDLPGGSTGGLIDCPTCPWSGIIGDHDPHDNHHETDM